MARTAAEIEALKTQGIKNNWSLLEFARSHGRMYVGKFTNKDTKEEFTACQFGSEGNYTMVAFSDKLGVLSIAEIAARKKELQVVELNSGHYCLCAIGANSWQEVDLFAEEAPAAAPF